MELFKIFGTIGLNGVETVNNQLSGVSNNAEKASGSITLSLKKLAGAVGLGFGVSKIVSFGKSVIGTTQTFSDAMLKVQSLSGASAEELKKLNDTALDYGSKTAWTSSQVADAMGYMALAGFNTDEIMASLDGTLSLASASGTDLAVASDILTDSLTAFGYSAEDANLFANVLATTQAKSNTTVDLLGESFKYVGTLAGSYKYSIEDVSSALGLMANSGIKGSMAGTSLSSIITRLATNTNGARDTIKKLGIEFYNSDGTARDLGDVITELCDATNGMTASEKASIASKIAGQEAQKGLLAILNQGSDTYKELNGTLKECDNSASTMATNMESGMGGAIRSIQSAWEGFKIKIGQKIEPGVTKVLHDLANFINNTLVPIMNGLIDTIGNIVKWFNKHKTITEILINTLKVLIATYVAFKAGAMIQGVIQSWQSAKVALALYSMQMNGASLAQGLLNGQLTLGETIVGLLTGKITLAELATALWTKAQAGLNAVMMANPVGLIVAGIVALIAIGVILYKKCDVFKKFIDKMFKGILDIAKKVLNFFKENWKTILLFIVNPFAGGFKLLYDKCEGFRKFVDNFVEKVKKAFNKIVDFFKNNWKGILLFMVNPFAGAFKILYDNCSGFRKFVDNLLNKIKSGFGKLASWFKGAWQSIKNAITKPFVDAYNGVKSAWEKIKSIIKMPHFKASGSWNPKEWLKGNVPKISVEWYKDGGIMTKPTLFGMNPNTGSAMVGGEAGKEAILPIDNLQTYVTTAVKEQTDGLSYTLNRMYDLLATVLPDIKNKDLQVVLDSGALVSGTVNKMDSELGNRATRKSRFGV